MTAMLPLNQFSKKRPIAIGLITCCVAFLGATWLNSDYAGQFRYDVRRAILDELVNIKPLSQGETVDVIYVLGGGQTSQRYKYEKVAELFKAGVTKKIWIINTPGITEYSEKLKRNYTNNEWALSELKEFGVPEENVEFVNVKKRFFGTFSEARDISVLLKHQRYKRILLLTQRYHTKRVMISFRHFLSDTDTSMFIQASAEKQVLRETIVEIIKLIIYKWFLV